MRIVTLFLLLFISTTFIAGQTITINGNVNDINNMPVKGAQVSSADGTFFTYSDNNGNYLLIIPDTVKEIVFYKIGYIRVIEKINHSNNINVTLASQEFTDLSLKELLQINVSTVSLSEQKIEDAPGIVSVITHDDLENHGIRTVREALIMVAGFSPLQNDDEQILAVRGIFATTNQKILLLRDGHSLNEANLDIPQTDYSLSIENIKKIEIIRGPGASIYGNSAMAAVVNIITYDGEKSWVKAGFGNYGQFNLEAVSGVKIADNGYFMTYGRISGNCGEQLDLGTLGNTNITYRTNHYPFNYDIGFKFRKKNFSSYFSAQKQSYRTYWSVNGMYTNVDSLLKKPGLKEESYHFGFEVEPISSDNISLRMQHYVDYCKLDNNRLLAPIDTDYYVKGRIQLNEWNVVKAGLNYFYTWQYSPKGQLLGGIAYEERIYLDSWLASNTDNPEAIVYSTKPFFKESNESRGAIYFQGQQPIFNWLKLDCGARYDIAQNFESSFNPRIALITKFIKHLTLKAIYTQAFQAPGYSYRTSNADFSGSISPLKPERLNTFQISARYEFLKASFYEITAYYNKLRNMITRTDKNYYANIGRYGCYGIESEIQINLDNFSIFSNYSFLLPDTNYMDPFLIKLYIKHNRFRNFAANTLNSGIVYHLGKILNFAVYSQYTTDIFALNDILLGSKVIVNSNIALQNLIKNTKIQLSIYNLTNTKYKLGDPTMLPVPQPGRWFMISGTYEFN
jgi:outer membrane receptor for ferrienterochelin and colicins